LFKNASGVLAAFISAGDWIPAETSLS